jgi:hypothetical protein
MLNNKEKYMNIAKKCLGIHIYSIGEGSKIISFEAYGKKWITGMIIEKEKEKRRLEFRKVNNVIEVSTYYPHPLYGPLITMCSLLIPSVLEEEAKNIKESNELIEIR